MRHRIACICEVSSHEIGIVLMWCVLQDRIDEFVGGPLTISCHIPHCSPDDGTRQFFFCSAVQFTQACAHSLYTVDVSALLGVVVVTIIDKHYRLSWLA